MHRSAERTIQLMPSRTTKTAQLSTYQAVHLHVDLLLLRSSMPSLSFTLPLTIQQAAETHHLRQPLAVHRSCAPTQLSGPESLFNSHTDKAPTSSLPCALSGITSVFPASFTVCRAHISANRHHSILCLHISLPSPQLHHFVLHHQRPALPLSVPPSVSIVSCPASCGILCLASHSNAMSSSVLGVWLRETQKSIMSATQKARQTYQNEYGQLGVTRVIGCCECPNSLAKGRRHTSSSLAANGRMNRTR